MEEDSKRGREERIKVFSSKSSVLLEDHSRWTCQNHTIMDKENVIGAQRHTRNTVWPRREGNPAVCDQEGLESTTLNEVSQTERDTFCTISVVCEIYKQTAATEAIRIVATRGVMEFPLSYFKSWRMML